MLRALRHRDFRLLWTGQAISLLGDGIYLVAIAWIVYDISNQPGALAVADIRDAVDNGDHLGAVPAHPEGRQRVGDGVRRRVDGAGQRRIHCCQIG